MSEAWAARAAAFVAAEVAPRGAEIDAAGAVPAALVAALAREGWLGLGAQALDPLALGEVHAAFGGACGATRSLLLVQAMVTEAVARWGTAAQKARWLGPLSRGEVLAAFALSEPGAGSDTDALQTAAAPDGDLWRLSGQKQWISFGASAGLLLVFARQEGGALGAFLVEGDADGLGRALIGRTQGLRGSALAALTLRNCLAARLRGGALPGLGVVASAALDLGRFCVAWGCVGIIEASLREARGWAQRRPLRGATLADAPLAQRALGQMALDARAARALCEEAARQRREGHAGAVEATLAAKLYAAAAASRVSAQALQLHGAAGCLEGALVERLSRDARVMEIIEGPTPLLEVLLGRAEAQRGCP